MQVRKLLMISLLSLTFLPVSASAQSWFVSPFVGANFGGSASFGDFPDADDEVERRMDLGATIGWNPNMVGFEVDFGWSPNFFEDTAGDRNFEFGDSNVTTFMGNLLISAPARDGARVWTLSDGPGVDPREYSPAVPTCSTIFPRTILGVNVGAGPQRPTSPRTSASAATCVTSARLQDAPAGQ